VRNDLFRYVLKRLLQLVFVLLAISLLVFTLSRGFPTKYPAWLEYVTATANPDQIATIKAQHGFNLPIYEQYFYWLRDIITGNWGISHWAGDQSTFHVFQSRFPLTVELAVSAMIVAIAVGIPLGIISATRSNRLPDHISRIMALSGYSIPVFWLGFLFQLLFAYYFKIWKLPTLPSSGYTDSSFIHNVRVITGIPILDGILTLNIPYLDSSIIHLILPMLTLSFVLMGFLARTTRSSMVDVLRQDFILLARSKGLSERVVIYRHALRNALIPTLTIGGVLFSYIIGGSVVIELVFSWPGVGWAALQAAFANDTNFLMLYSIVAAFIIGIISLVIDISYSILDPRIKLT
jgi:ABC-type dipeptide/oligopeptide/nickel transport system permease component